MLSEENPILNDESKEEEEKDILEIIEELSGDEFDIFTATKSCSTSDIPAAAAVEEEKDGSFDVEDAEEGDLLPEAPKQGSLPGLDFSMSNIKFKLGIDALHGSVGNLGVATASLFKLPSSPHKEGLNGSSHHTAATSSSSSTARSAPRSLLARLGGSDHSNYRNGSTVDFGEFEARAARLQYTQQDIFSIVDDPEQFDELKAALRSLGAVTNSLLKTKVALVCQEFQTRTSTTFGRATTTEASGGRRTTTTATTTAAAATARRRRTSYSSHGRQSDGQ